MQGLFPKSRVFRVYSIDVGSDLHYVAPRVGAWIEIVSRPYLN
jgi:hypothetical protein